MRSRSESAPERRGRRPRLHAVSAGRRRLLPGGFAGHALQKAPTGIDGFDEVTGGGLPLHRAALVCGAAGAGKTIFGMEFLIHGALQFREPGVFLSFEETREELGENFASMGFGLEELVRRRKLVVDYIHIDPHEIEETGEYDLDGLFIRIGQALRSIGARRLVLDSIEGLFSGLRDQMTLRAELRRLFRWLKSKKITCVVTAEKGGGGLTRHGLEEYVADCVIFLDHRMSDEIGTRRLRVVKYRGSLHGTNEYPFLIGSSGVSVLPISSVGADHTASRERISTGVATLDSMLGEAGFFRGSSVLISGAPGTGKTSLAAILADAACRRGERVLYFAFEESESEIVRNMSSIGLHLDRWRARGLLQFHAARCTVYGLEQHLVAIHDAVRKFAPDVAVIDPLSGFTAVGTRLETKAMLARVLDYLKAQHATAIFTDLTADSEFERENRLEISSLMDAWLLLRNVERGGRRDRTLFIVKSRGIAHSNQVREFLLTSHGIRLLEFQSADHARSVGRALPEGDRSRPAAPRLAS